MKKQKRIKLRRLSRVQMEARDQAKLDRREAADAQLKAELYAQHNPTPKEIAVKCEFSENTRYIRSHDEPNIEDLIQFSYTFPVKVDKSRRLSEDRGLDVWVVDKKHVTSTIKAQFPQADEYDIEDAVEIASLRVEAFNQ